MKATKETIARTIATAAVAVLAVIKMIGIDVPALDESAVYSAILPVVTVIVWIWGYWKNNDFTKEAIEGTKYMKVLKMHKEAGDEVVVEGGEA